MAGRTLAGRGLIEQDIFTFDHPRQLVTTLTAYIAVHPREREAGTLVMVEQRWLPAGAIVAVRTGSRSSGRELPAMDIRMAVLALRRRRPEVHINQLSLQVGRLVAIHAGGGTVRAQQRKRSRGMVEGREILPGFRRMAGLAARRLAIRSLPLHALAELAVMRIRMATGARELVPVIKHRRLGLEAFTLFMTIPARHRNMAARQEETRFLVLRQGKSRRPIPVQVMAAFAGIEVRGGRELPHMLILMTVGAALELDLEQRVFPARDMALPALQCRVLPLQRVRRRGVLS